MTTILFATVVWELTSSGGVLSPDLDSRSGEPDALVTTDGRGNPTVPATSLAGSLRSHVATLTSSDPIALFGGDVAGKLTPSKVTLVGSAVTPGEVGRVIEQRTAIDRVSGAARNRTLRVREFLPTGTRIEAYVRAESLSADEQEQLVASLTTWEPSLGAGVSTGHGATRRVSVTSGVLDLDDPDDLLTYLTQHGPALHEKVAGQEQHSLPTSIARPHLALAFKIDGSLAIGDGGTTKVAGTSKSGTHEVATVVRRNGQPVVPGSTWKGVLRSRVEFVLRSLPAVTTRPCLSGTCSKCLPCKVFGYAGGEESRRSEVRFHDSPIVSGPVTERQHVAIDRFTGGAADGLLYTNEVVEGGTMTLRVDALDAAHWDLAKALILLAALDLDAGFGGLGRNVTRGYGQIRLQGVDEADRIAAQQTVRAWLNESQEATA